jgi:Resolvase, N terminal domain
MGSAMNESDKTPRRSAKKARCAIYTRKSSEEGLEQAFNSLDAQREACAAFILSQKHEGWTVLPALYDDGGFSGGTMERPALKKLCAHSPAYRAGPGSSAANRCGPGYRGAGTGTFQHGVFSFPAVRIESAVGRRAPKASMR